MDISIILPCKNEEIAIGSCINNIKSSLVQNKLTAEIIIADSSSDKSELIAKQLGAIVVKPSKNGYGAAYLEAFKHAQGKYIIMADADGSYDFSDIPKFLKLLKSHDVVIGNRVNMEKGAMPFSHKYIGNPFLSSLVRILFKLNVKDVHCGIRAIKTNSLKKLNLKSPGMEFATEFIIKAHRANLNIGQLDVKYFKRKGKPKLRTFKDGFRHLNLILKQVNKSKV